MKLCSAREMATRWGISIQLVRRYCKEGKIADAVLSEQGWMIPEGALKPGALAAREAVITPLVKRILYERERNNHYGIYEYIQVNLAYSSSRMASNRLTLMQVEDIYRTNKIATAFEPTKVDDIIEIKNHFIAMRYIVDNIHTPLSVDFIRQVQYLLSYGTHADIYLPIEWESRKKITTADGNVEVLYQGVISQKEEIKDRYHALRKSIEKEEKAFELEDWERMKQLLDTIVFAFTKD